LQAWREYPPGQADDATHERSRKAQSGNLYMKKLTPYIGTVVLIVAVVALVFRVAAVRKVIVGS
jgi:hypothetical protein